MPRMGCAYFNMSSMRWQHGPAVCDVSKCSPIQSCLSEICSTLPRAATGFQVSGTRDSGKGARARAIVHVRVAARVARIHTAEASAAGVAEIAAAPREELSLGHVYPVVTLRIVS